VILAFIFTASRADARYALLFAASFRNYTFSFKSSLRLRSAFSRLVSAIFLAIALRLAIRLSCSILSLSLSNLLQVQFMPYSSPHL
jgi:hypothetical protein